MDGLHCHRFTYRVGRIKPPLLFFKNIVGQNYKKIEIQIHPPFFYVHEERNEW